jgi:hypothetical protein
MTNQSEPWPPQAAGAMLAGMIDPLRYVAQQRQRLAQYKIVNPIPICEVCDRGARSVMSFNHYQIARSPRAKRIRRVIPGCTLDDLIRDLVPHVGLCLGRPPSALLLIMRPSV